MNSHEGHKTWEIPIQELYTMLHIISKVEMGLEQLPFSLADLENPPEPKNKGEALETMNIESFIHKCYKYITDDDSDAQAIKLIKSLQENHPKVNFENPKIPGRKCSLDETRLMRHIFLLGIDLPGSKHNLYGKPGYYSDFFIDMFFGNYTEFMEHVNKLSAADLNKCLSKREGYGQYSPIFAPILGYKMLNLELVPYLTSKEKEEAKSMYSGNNENKQLDILNKLLELGADPNAYDIHGFTPLHSALLYINYGMARALLNHGANPNAESRCGMRPLAVVKSSESVNEMRVVELLLGFKAKLTNKEDANDLRSSVERHGSKDLAVKVRSATPRENNECEKCAKSAEKRCKACGLACYCSVACQKLDWKFHKVFCQRFRRDFTRTFVLSEE